MSREQQSARVNVSHEDWLAFRTLAMQQYRSVADYMGELVRIELGKSPRKVRPRATEPVPTTAKRSAPVRLADHQLLTELPCPRRRPEPPPWEV